MKFIRHTIFFLLIIKASLFPQPSQQHVILVIIDGARYSETLGDPTGQYVPRMKQLSAQGALVDTFLNDSLTYTKRAIPAIWCGSWSPPEDTTIDGYLTQYATVPTVWEYFRKDMSAESTDAMYILKQLNGPWLPSYHPQYGRSFWPWYIMQDWSDLYVWQNAKSKLTSYHPVFSVLYFADVDHAGHSGDWQEYTRAITVADSIVGMLWDFVQNDPVYKDRTTIFVTNDHGRHLDGVSTGFVGHGDGCWGCRRIEFLAVGSGVRPGLSAVRRKIPDIVPTIGALLNFSSPFSTGDVMAEILKPIITCPDDTIDFGDVAVSQVKTDSFKIFNSGGVDLTLSIDGDSDFTIMPDTAVIPPHGQKTFLVTFTPVAEEEKEDLITFTHNDTHQKDTMIVRGTGISQITLSVGVRKGWNIVSIPVQAEDIRVISVFPDAVSLAYSYSGTYEEQDSLTIGSGYWVKFDSSANHNTTGKIILADTIDVVEGWNMIGSASIPLSADSVLSLPENNISSAFFSYIGSYIQVDSILPGFGYWVKVGSDGKLILR